MNQMNTNVYQNSSHATILDDSSHLDYSNNFLKNHHANIANLDIPKNISNRVLQTDNSNTSLNGTINNSLNTSMNSSMNTNIQQSIPSTLNSSHPGQISTAGGTPHNSMNTIVNNGNTTTKHNTVSVPPNSNYSTVKSNGQTTEANTAPGANSTKSFNALHFPFHNPFDVNSYPITNPPIFDSTMMLPYVSNDGVPRRRRISISNGQIGQIVNHEAFFDTDNTFDDIPPHPFQSSQSNLQSNNIQNIPSTSQQSFVPVNQNQSTTKIEQSSEQVLNAAGVPPPNYQLMYNNEVIYNPNDGPIPGTAAWKKERLLERNRIAASKCRQRKKHAQQQLQSNVTKYEKQLEDYAQTIEKYERLVEIYNTTLEEYFKKDAGELEKLRKFVSLSIDEIQDSDLNFN